MVKSPSSKEMASSKGVNSLLDFSGERILVTGGGRGIGKGIALKFLELNAHVIVLDKDQGLLRDLNKEFPSIETVSVDLTNWDETRKAVEKVLPIHHLANNAGVVDSKPFPEIDLNHIDAVFDVNFKAALNVAQVVAKGMIAREIKNGTIVNTSSVFDTVAFERCAVYAATKAALTMLTKTMAVELAHFGIRVNCIRPGAVGTELARNVTPEVHKVVVEPLLQRQLSHEFVEVEEVAHAVVFLSSTMSAKITGTGLAVDEGYTVQ